MLGTTLWLPPRAEDASDGCGAVQWRVALSPDGNQNEVVDGVDGVPRFTPHLPGTYRFEAAGAEPVTREVMPVPSGFHNFNFYPTHGIAAAGEDVWVASVLSPVLIRLDASTLQPLDEVAVGSWPVAVAAVPESSEVLVAHRGGDTLGIVDADAGRIVDAIWVGDEPADVVVSPQGDLAYVALPTQGEVAVVDLASRAVLERFAAMPDANTLALSPDGGRLFVAPRRSGHPEREPFDADPTSEERDIVALSTEDGSDQNVWIDVGTTIGQLMVSADGKRLYATLLQNDTVASLSEESEPSFTSQLIVWSATSGDTLGMVDLSEFDTPLVGVSGIVESGGLVWVAAEGNDIVVAIDPTSLEVTQSVGAKGRPRALASDGTRVLAWGHQARTVTALTAAGVDTEVVVSGDPRPTDVADGQAFFTGAGEGFGRYWSCNGCHADGLTDRLIWNAGPLSNRVVSRPFAWLEGTAPLGWAGYLSSVENYAYTVTGNVGIRPVTDQALSLGAYLGSLMPPAPANHLTRRDGTLSEEALAGQSVYEANCAGCHPLPLTTTNAVYADGVTEGVSVVPNLVGAYRYGTWLKYGNADEYASAAALAGAAFGSSLSEQDSAALVRYLGELTGRDFFPLRVRPGSDVPLAVDAVLEIDFSLPVWTEADNLSKVTLAASGGPAVAARVEVDGRHMSLTPESALQPGTQYTLRVDEGFESQEGWVAEPHEHTFTTAAELAAPLPETLVWVFETPSLDFASGGWDTQNTTQVRIPVAVQRTASGATLELDLGGGLVMWRDAVLDGRTLHLPAVAVPVGPSFADFVPQAVELSEDDELIAEGTGRFAGPGFELEDIAWRLEPERENAPCEPGSDGLLALEIGVDASDAMTIAWASEDDGIGLWVTDPEAEIPLGPGEVEGGDTYWSLSSENPPAEGFAQPLTYGVTPQGAVEDTQRHGGSFRELVVGECYKVSVATTAFQLGSRTLRWEPSELGE